MKIRARCYEVVDDIDNIAGILRVIISELSEDELESFLDDLELQKNNLEALL